jgi:hypothetical protein
MNIKLRIKAPNKLSNGKIEIHLEMHHLIKICKHSINLVFSRLKVQVALRLRQRIGRRLPALLIPINESMRLGMTMVQHKKMVLDPDAASHKHGMGQLQQRMLSHPSKLNLKTTQERFL